MNDINQILQNMANALTDIGHELHQLNYFLRDKDVRSQNEVKDIIEQLSGSFSELFSGAIEAEQEEEDEGIKIREVNDESIEA